MHSDPPIKYFFDTMHAIVIAAVGVLTLLTHTWGETQTMIDPHLRDPIWISTTTDRESILFIQPTNATCASAHLLFAAARIQEVTSADHQTTFTLDKDFKLAANGRELVLLPGTAIPFRKASDFFLPKNSPHSLAHRAGQPEQWLLWGEGDFFLNQQVEVTYQHQPAPWAGRIPVQATKLLPRTIAKLSRKQPITISISGDSISKGYNASGFIRVAPFQSPFVELVATQLEAVTGRPIKLSNHAVAGWKSQDGLANTTQVIADKPDLVIIAYGMNDIPRHQPKEFKTNIAGIIAAIHTANPQTEIILVAPMQGNPDSVHYPPKSFEEYRQILESLTGPGIALADVTSLWQELLKRKRFADLTGNGINHPNDFGHRLYAQVILALLLPTPGLHHEPR